MFCTANAVGGIASIASGSRPSWAFASSARKAWNDPVTDWTDAARDGGGVFHGAPGYFSISGYCSDWTSKLPSSGTHSGSMPRGPRFRGVPGAPNVQRPENRIIHEKNETDRTR